MATQLTLNNSTKLYEQALELIPGAILGIRRPYNFVPGEYPIFFDHAKGGKVVDVDGNEYIDMLCAYGPIIIGHREEEIDNAVIEQIKNKGFCMSLTQEVQNTLANKMQQLIPSCQKSVFVKTGSDATSAAIRIARGYTKRKKIIRCGYHGWHDWCIEVKGGIPTKLYEDVYEFSYNNLNQLERLMNEHSHDVAAIIITPLGHPLAQPVEMPEPNFLETVRQISEHYGALLVFDEVRSGFRVGLGGAQKEFGITPDLSVFGKAMGNGYPISAVVGKAEIMDVLKSEVYLSSTFFPNSLEQIAALKTIEIIERDDVLGDIKNKGEIFAEQVSKVIANSKVNCTFSGGPWMPYITFNKDDLNKYKELRASFYTKLIRRKVFLQPYHHGYIAYRHTSEDLKYVAEMIEESLKELEKDL
ncbi:MAG: aminotransferase class III-fold pyridoxal phosphate-dependent enzyme [Bacteriovoracaceae bacterium]|nr:aminotransferase class III-fold pyridoxal phosphate-dependent enzyme [Bacteriovoracaceae bacterium]